MGSIPSELSFDYRRMPTAVATDVARGENLFQKTISKLVAEVSVIRHISENFSKVDDYAKRLEEETKKIEAFKRELPLCMLLLRDGSSPLSSSSLLFVFVYLCVCFLGSNSFCFVKFIFLFSFLKVKLIKWKFRCRMR